MPAAAVFENSAACVYVETPLFDGSRGNGSFGSAELAGSWLAD
jgi:hypothetical protein